MKINAFSKTYQNRTVLSFPGFDFQSGKIYAVIGANGSGKSTFAKIVSGNIKPDSSSTPVFSSRISVGYLPQKPYAFHMSLRKNLLLNSEKAEKDFIQRKADTLIEAFQLTALSKTKATALSGGETARMCLARLMMKDYAFLILDEPCAAMDIESTLQTELLIKEYCHKTNTCCLLITHSLSQAKRLADDVLFLHHGQLLEYGPTDSLLNHPVHPETKRFLEFFGQQTV